MKRADRQVRCESLKAEQASFAEDLWCFARDRWGGFEDDAEGWFGRNYHRVARDGQIFSAWALFHDRRRGRTALEEYLAQRDTDLAPLRFAVVSAELAAWISYWEVADLNERRGLHMRDLLTGQECWVQDEAGAATLQRGLVVCGRVLRLEGLALFGGVFPIALPRRGSQVSALVTVGRKYYGRASGGVRPSVLRAPGEPLAILNCWRMAAGLLWPPDPIHPAGRVAA